MMEVGPWRLDGKGGLNLIEGGWEEYTTMVYGTLLYCYLIPLAQRNATSVDQPAGAGFSYTSSDHYLHDIPEVSSTANLVPVVDRDNRRRHQHN